MFVILFVMALKVIIVMWKVRLFCEVIVVMLMLLLLVVMVIIIVMVSDGDSNSNVESEDIQWSDCGGNATMVLMLGPRHR